MSADVNSKPPVEADAAVEAPVPTRKAFEPSLKNRIAGLDELRGISILLVLICHGIYLLWAPFSLVALAYLGVNIFFVISGFLICTILVQDRERPGYFRRFYVRRIFRIWPLFLLISAAGLAYSVAINKPAWNALVYYLTFTMNFAAERTAGGIVMDQAGDSWLIPLTSPMWSLAIEEQFYLTLPLLVFLLRPRDFPKVIALICALSIAGALVAMCWSTDPIPALAYTNFKNTAMRIHYLGLGVLIAVRPPIAYVVCGFWLAATLVVPRFGGALEAAIALGLVWLVHRTVSTGPLFRNAALARAGFLCYGLYLIHWPILRFTGRVRDVWLGNTLSAAAVCFVAYLFLSFLAAHYSFKWFENPIQHLRVRFEERGWKPGSK